MSLIAGWNCWTGRGCVRNRKFSPNIRHRAKLNGPARNLLKNNDLASEQAFLLILGGHI